MNWTDLERAFTAAERLRVTAVAWRAGCRVAPVVARAVEVYGPEALEWLNAVAASLGVTERFAAGLTPRPSRFTLDLAADVARTAATAGANAARLLGPSKAGEDAELAFAAAAFAADVCRAPNAQRAAVFAMQGVRAADATGLIPRELLDADVAKLGDGEFGELWPGGEPDWWRDGQARLKAAGPMLRVLAQTGG
jgi:hypothetical protein